MRDNLMSNKGSEKKLPAALNSLALSLLLASSLSTVYADSDMSFSTGASWKITTDKEKRAEGNSGLQVKPVSRPGANSARAGQKWIPINPNSLNWSGAQGASKAKPQAALSASERPGATYMISKSTNQKVLELEKQAQEVIAGGDYKTAYSLLDQAAKLDPKSVSAHFNKGLMAEQLSKWSEAREEFRQAVSIDPTLRRATVETARSYAKDGERSRAIEILWELKSRSNNMHEGMEKRLFYKDAEESADGLLVELGDEKACSVPLIISHASEGEIIRGVLSLDKLGKSEMAMQLIRELERHRLDARKQEFVASYLLRAGKYQEALYAFQKAQELDPTGPNAMLGEIDCCTRLGMLEEIQKLKTEFVSRFPDNSNTPKFKEAIEYYTKDFKNIRERESLSSTKQINTDKASFSKYDMPIKIYIPDLERASVQWESPPDPDLDCPGIVIKALEAWANAAPGKLSFKTVGSFDEANIAIDWVNDGAKMSHSFAAGTTGYAQNSKGGALKQIKLLVPTGKDAGNTSKFTHTTLHEFGHALGLSHSSDPQDIMYFSSGGGSSDDSLSDQDKTRVNSMYGY